ncbi:MAG: SpoIIIAH-like family protein, partial [Niameybacter sp.]
VGTKEVVIAKKDASQENVATVDSKNVDVSYFAEEKMLREQSRAKQIETLNEYVADPNLDKESKSKAANDLLTIQERIEKETGAESLLRAKGFKDVFVRMDADTVDVVVNKEEALTDGEIAQIEEIVQRKTGYTVGQIKISCLKVNNQTANK